MHIRTFQSNFMYILANFLVLFWDVIYCWFANIELMANSSTSHALMYDFYPKSDACVSHVFVSHELCITWMTLMYHMYFCFKAHHSPLVLRSTTQHFNIMLGDHLNNKIITKKHKIAKKAMIVNRLKKRHLFTLSELKQEGRVLFSQLQLGMCTSNLLYIH